ncbi:MAG: SpoIIE family protein phosphatase [Pyramidobacter sp.]|nr:SpoIIE family protein phosphatase [Pyramidobacter sp.]
MFIDIHCEQQRKFGQNATGDAFLSSRQPGGRLIAVLSDGLGSGIKANILALMTSTMLLRFIEEDMPIKKAATTIMNSLPVCQVRKISYATFSAVDCDDEGNVKIVEEGNPDFIWLRGSTPMKAECQTIVSSSFPNRKMKVYRFKALLGDRLVFCSDGVTQAGLGRPEYRLGLRRSGLQKFVCAAVEQSPEIASSTLASQIIAKALEAEGNGQAGDDISACVLYFRKPRKSVVFTGGPYNQNRDGEYALAFSQFDGRKAICGGTTSNIISRELKRPITTPICFTGGDLPPLSYMEGVDLITEGILTLTRTLEYLERGVLNCQDAAGQLVQFFMDSDVIEFMLGAKLNQAHYDPSLPIEMELRKDVVHKIASVLEKKYLKRVVIQHI